MKYKKWDIWYAYCEFEGESDAGKDRPVLVIGENQEVFVLSLMITGTRERDQNDYRIEKWKEAGLSKPSVIRTERRFKLPPRIQKKGGASPRRRYYAFEGHFRDIVWQ
jgi:hypothetical protein